MNSPLKLAEWLTAPRPADTLIAWSADQRWTLGYLRCDVAALIPYLQQQQATRWALCFDNSYLFIVALLATLHAGKIPVLPGHNRAALLNEQQTLFDGILSDGQLAWTGPSRLVTSSMQSADTDHFPALHRDAVIELYTSGSTGTPKRVVKTRVQLDAEAALLAALFAERLSGCRVVSSVAHQHLYGLTFRIMLPLALGLPLHADVISFAEQLSALDRQHRYTFISSPAFLKRLDYRLPPPPFAVILSAGGELNGPLAAQAAAGLQVWPDEIYGSTETGVIAWRSHQQPDASWQPLPGVEIRHEDKGYRLFSPLITDERGLMLDDRLDILVNGQFRLQGRRDRVVKIEEKRVSLNEVELRLLALDGVREAAALPINRSGRQSIGIVLVLDDSHRENWGKKQELAWRKALRAWLEPLAIPRYWRIVDEIPVNGMNKRVDAQLQELFDETRRT
ncbi:AMP-binding protein [Kluyvera genomosp. 1]|uniref:AMP-binding protein n=1 Tax=Kluyvera genomosp. 1 TaxID=2774053 RepID=UPI00068CAE95|nr:AMP-binding protein [Kluyvera genomosp. 1]